MRELTDSEIIALQWGDTNFFGYYWDNQFSDPTLIIRVAPAGTTVQELVCNWATHLKLNLDYTDHVNSLLTWKVTFEKSPNETWAINFDFANQGTIKFECNKLALRPLNDTAKS